MAWISEQLLQTIGRHALNECITRQKIIELTKLDVRQVENALTRLVENELLERTKPGCYQLTTYGHIALAEGKEKLRSGPRGKQNRVRIYKNSLRSKVWRAICIKSEKGKFSVSDIEESVITGNEKDAKNNIHHYLKLLERAGYLVKMKKKTPGTKLTSNGFARWWLPKEKYTGPLAPVHRLDHGCMHDPNTGEDVPL